MGSHRQKLAEGVSDMKDRVGEIDETGSEMVDQATEIKSLLDGIDLPDDEDMEAIESASDAYGGSFDGAHAEQIDPMVGEVGEQGDEIGQEVEDATGRLERGEQNLEQAAGISEIGRDNAENARGTLEASAGEYGEIKNDAEQTSREAQEMSQRQMERLDSIFG